MEGNSSSSEEGVARPYALNCFICTTAPADPVSAAHGQVFCLPCKYRLFPHTRPDEEPVWPDDEDLVRVDERLRDEDIGIGDQLRMVKDRLEAELHALEQSLLRAEQATEYEAINSWRLETDNEMWRRNGRLHQLNPMFEGRLERGMDRML